MKAMRLKIILHTTFLGMTKIYSMYLVNAMLKSHDNP